MKLTCSICKRDFSVSEIYEKMVDVNKIEPICGYCDNSCDDDKEEVDN